MIVVDDTVIAGGSLGLVVLVVMPLLRQPASEQMHEMERF